MKALEKDFIRAKLFQLFRLFQETENFNSNTKSFVVAWQVSSFFFMNMEHRHHQQTAPTHSKMLHDLLSQPLTLVGVVVVGN